VWESHPSLQTASTGTDVRPSLWGNIVGTAAFPKSITIGTIGHQPTSQERYHLQAVWSQSIWENQSP